MKPELIETMRADAHGQIALWDLHMARLRHSARVLGYSMASPSSLAMQVALQIAAARPIDNQLPAAWRVRLLLNHQGAVQVTVAALLPLPAVQKVALARTPLNSKEFWLPHKSSHRPWYDVATAWLANHPEYFDVIFLNERGEICEGSRSNVYVRQEDRWLTPPTQVGLLPGVLRTQLLQQGQVTESLLHGDLLQTRPSVRLSNGLRGWFDVELDLEMVV